MLSGGSDDRLLFRTPPLRLHTQHNRADQTPDRARPPHAKPCAPARLAMLCTSKQNPSACGRHLYTIEKWRLGGPVVPLAVRR